VTAGSGKQGCRKAVALPLSFQKWDNWARADPANKFKGWEISVIFGSQVS